MTDGESRPFSIMDDAVAWKTCRSAVRSLGISDPDWENRATSWLIQAIIELRVIRAYHPPSGSDVIKALEQSAEATAELATALATLLAGRATASVADGESGQMRRDVSRMVVGAVCSALGLGRVAWDDEAIQTPLVGQLSSLSRNLAAIGADFEAADFRRSTRPIDRAELQLIKRLSRLYEDATAKKATASHGGRPGYRGPFATFVDQIWPLTGIRRTLSNKALRERLRLVCPITPSTEP